jgi:hypothetical protein
VVWAGNPFFKTRKAWTLEPLREKLWLKCMWIKECLMVFWWISHHFAWEKKKANVHLTPLDNLEILVKSKIIVMPFPCEQLNQISQNLNNHSYEKRKTSAECGVNLQCKQGCTSRRRSIGSHHSFLVTSITSPNYLSNITLKASYIFRWFVDWDLRLMICFFMWLLWSQQKNPDIGFLFEFHKKQFNFIIYKRLKMRG